MILNLIHRPEGPPPHLQVFRWQQDLAHALGLKVTVLLDLPALENSTLIAQLQQDHLEYGDELGFWFSPHLPTPDQTQENGGQEIFIWLYSRAEKEQIILEWLRRFREVLGFTPTAWGAYHLDTDCMELLKTHVSGTKIAVAGCFEEGVRVFHGCNNSWYLFNEGMPWTPWYPSRGHSLRPASSVEDWSGIVAVPHLVRDLVLSYEGRNDFFATHPQNVQRAQANLGGHHPYDQNLLTQYQLQEDYNAGFSYINVSVSPGWLAQNPNIQDDDEISTAIYRDYLEHFVALRSNGALRDLYLSEFADEFCREVPIPTPQVALAKDVLYGSGKHYVWYADPQMRVTVDATQGGSIGDLRPYASSYRAHTGRDAVRREIGSFPYLIQSQHRSGNAHHHRDGSRTTALVSCGTETVDLCNCPTRVEAIERDLNGIRVRLSPAQLCFSGSTAWLQTRYHFLSHGRIEVTRSLLSSSDLILQGFCVGSVQSRPVILEGLR